jgi:hypothetical protein
MQYGDELESDSGDDPTQTDTSTTEEPATPPAKKKS